MIPSSPSAAEGCGTCPERSRAERLAPATQHLGLAADLYPARSPRIHRDHVVHEERHPGVALHILVLLVPGEVVSADIDRVRLRVVVEQWNETGTTCGRPSEPTVASRPRSWLSRYSISSSWNTLMPHHPPRRRRPGALQPPSPARSSTSISPGPPRRPRDFPSGS
jgi:hypothetical protein